MAYQNTRKHNFLPFLTKRARKSKTGTKRTKQNNKKCVILQTFTIDVVLRNAAKTWYAKVYKCNATHTQTRTKQKCANSFKGRLRISSKIKKTQTKRKTLF